VGVRYSEETVFIEMSWLWGGGKEARSDGRQDMITSTSKKDEEQSQEKEGGFWGFIESVKEKSKEVASAYKEDIGVFASTLKDETKEVMKEIRTEEGKAGLFLDGWSSALQKVVKKYECLWQDFHALTCWYQDGGRLGIN